MKYTIIIECVGCHSDKMDFSGNDIKRINNYVDPVDCQQACLENSECEFWTLGTTKNTCYLKNKRFTKDRAHSTAISGSKTCSDCYEHGIEYVGHHIVTISQTLSSKDCQEICRENGMCEYWTHHKTNKQCKLKSARQAKPINSATVNHISGPKHCVYVKELISEPRCSSQLLAVSGGQIGAQTISKSLTNCYSSCQATTSCKYSFWNSNNQACTKHNSQSQIQLDESKQHIWTTPNKCNDCFIENLSINDQTLRELESSNKHDCQKFCYKHDGCEHWDFNHLTNKCRLKATRNNVVYSDKNTVGNRECNYFHSTKSIQPQLSRTLLGCMEDGIRYDGTTIDFFNDVATPFDCQNYCKNHEKCLYFSFNSISAICYLKSENDAKLSKDTISGPKDCPSTTESDSDERNNDVALDITRNANVRNGLGGYDTLYGVDQSPELSPIESEDYYGTNDSGFESEFNSNSSDYYNDSGFESEFNSNSSDYYNDSGFESEFNSNSSDYYNDSGF